LLTTYRRLLDLLDARERRRFALLMAMVLVMGLIDMAGVASIIPFLGVLSNPGMVETSPYLAPLYDRLGFTDTHSFLLLLGAVTFALVVFGQLFKALTMYAIVRFARLREYTIGSRLLAGYLRQPYAWFLNRHSADLGKSVLSEVDKVIVGVVVPALNLVAQAVVAICLALVLVVVHPLAALGTAILVGGAYGVILHFTGPYLRRIGRDRLRANEERYRLAQEAMGGVKDVKLLGLEDVYLTRFRDPASRFARRQAAAGVIGQLPRYLLEAIVFGAMLGLVLTLLATAEGRLDSVLPVVGVYAFAGARLFPAMQTIYGGLTALRFNGPSLEALVADLRANPPAAPPACAVRTAASAAVIPRERIEFRGVRYSYPEATRPALDGLDMVIDANTTVGIVGTTGAGKTTAVDVLLGLLQPHSGELLVDGVPIDGRNRRAWQRAIGYVPQHIFLTDDSIAANIALGLAAEHIDMAAVERAARIAELHRFVSEELPRGYHTKVGERGVRLSGGQRQRIGMARALYQDPAVLVLDEATSALDNRTERAVMDAVANLAHTKSIVMIAHRLSTVRGCDTIFVLEHGKCVASGRYDELVNRNPTFRKLALPAS
jgi:ABC-type multidrug transport system fused ATPase/permease subunit